LLLAIPFFGASICAKESHAANDDRFEVKELRESSRKSIT
jgi:hypothetical protein